jgi:hypothetical protein
MANQRCATLVLSLTPLSLCHSRLASVILRLAFMLSLLADFGLADNVPRTLQSFGVRANHSQPVYPLPPTVALGLFNSDRLLDVACYADDKVQVYQNLGNGTFAPVWEKRVTGNVEKLEWRATGNLRASIADPSNWGELVVHYADGRSELVPHEQMFGRGNNLPAGGFTSLPRMNPPLSFHKAWQSEPNPGLAVDVAVDDIDSDGKQELVYLFNAAVDDSTRRLVVYECVGNDSFVVDWDTVMYSTDGGPLAITDIDNDGHKEIVTAYFPYGVGVLPTISFLECEGPHRYRYYYTNIGFQRPLFTAQETDINHNGIKELTVLTSDPNATFDETLVYVAEFAGKSSGFMAFNQQIARYQWYTFNLAVGQVDGQGWDEIIPAGGSFGYHEPVPVDYLWYSGMPGPTLWLTRGIYTGLQSGTGAVMFVNLDADSATEFVSGAPGPIGHGSMFALKYQHDTTWSVMWADSSLMSAPLWVSSGQLNGQFVVAGANTWWPTGDFLWSELRAYQTFGSLLGIWHRDSLSIQDFHLLDVDRDGRTDLIFAQLSHLINHRLVVYESDTIVVGVNPPMELPERFDLFQNYPNPFNPTTTIRFELPTTGEVELLIYDILGREEKALLREELAGGSHTAIWNGTNEKGGEVSSGVYFYRLAVRGSQGLLYTQTKKMLLLR